MKSILPGEIIISDTFIEFRNVFYDTSVVSSVCSYVIANIVIQI